MDGEMRETLSLIAEIFTVLGTRIPVELLDRFLQGGTDEKDYISNSELNEGLSDYIKNYLAKDVASESRMVRLGKLYLPLLAIKKWEVDEKYSYLDSKPQYRLVINSAEQNPGLFGNLIAVYDSQEERQRDIEKLLEMKLSYPQL